MKSGNGVATPIYGAWLAWLADRSSNGIKIMVVTGQDDLLVPWMWRLRLIGCTQLARLQDRYMMLFDLHSTHRHAMHQKLHPN